MDLKSKIILISGPTASGKSKFAIKLAKKISSEQNKINKRIKLFIQLNIDNEKQKSGILVNELEDFYQSLIKE